MQGSRLALPGVKFTGISFQDAVTSVCGFSSVREAWSWGQAEAGASLGTEGMQTRGCSLSPLCSEPR